MLPRTHARALSAAMLGLAVFAAAMLLVTLNVVAQDDAPPDFENDALDAGDPFAAAAQDDAFDRAAEERVNAGNQGSGGTVQPKEEAKKTPGPAALAALGALAGVALALRRR